MKRLLKIFLNVVYFLLDLILLIVTSSERKKIALEHVCLLKRHPPSNALVSHLHEITIGVWHFRVFSFLNFESIVLWNIIEMAKRGANRKEMEELKKRQDQEAAAEVFLIHSNYSHSKLHEFLQVFEEFVATFQEDSSKVSKVWIKAGTYDAGQKSTYSVGTC